MKLLKLQKHKILYLSPDDGPTSSANQLRKNIESARALLGRFFAAGRISETLTGMDACVDRGHRLGSLLAIETSLPNEIAFAIAPQRLELNWTGFKWQQGAERLHSSFARKMRNRGPGCSMR